MNKKLKERLLIVILGVYLSLTVWLVQYLYNAKLSESYEEAFWATVIFHYCVVYVIVAHYTISKQHAE